MRANIQCVYRNQTKVHAIGTNQQNMTGVLKIVVMKLALEMDLEMALAMGLATGLAMDLAMDLVIVLRILVTLHLTLILIHQRRVILYGIGMILVYGIGPLTKLRINSILLIQQFLLLTHFELCVATIN